LESQVQSGKLWGEGVAPAPVIQIGLTSTPDANVKSGDDLLKQTRHSLGRKD
jgi:hypothetical protein